MVKITESQIQKQVMDLLRLKGYFVFKVMQGFGCHKGVADLYAIKEGRSIWAEIKTPVGRMSKHQEKFRDDVISRGGEYIVIRCVEDVEGL